MRSGRRPWVGLDILMVMLLAGTLLPVAWAQTENAPGPPVAPGPQGPPTPGIGEANAGLIAVALGIAVLVLVIAVVKAIDLKRKGDEEAVRLQAQISDALLRDRTLASLPVTPTVLIPMWRRSPVTIEMHGQVPTVEFRKAVIHVAEQEASRTLAACHIQDRIAVVSSVGMRAA